MVKKHYDIIVIGAGSVGMAAGYYLGKSGMDTLLLDAHTPPHEDGSHHGETRLIRHAVGEGPQYMPLIMRAQELWEELEQTTNRKLFYKTGTVLAGNKDAPFINKTIEVANQFSLTLEKLTYADLKENWPQFSVPEPFIGYYEPSSGALLNEEIIEAYKVLNHRHDVTMQSNTKVTKLIPSVNGHTTVKTKYGTYYADKVIITVGAWINEFLKQLDIHLPIHVVRKTFGWFQTDQRAYSYHKLPCFYFNFDNQRYYGFPDITGSGVKIGRNDAEIGMDPNLMKEDFGKYTSDAADLKTFAKKHIPYIYDKFSVGKACMITKTPDKNFIIDRHPYFNNMFIAGGFSGHGFKYSSVIGEILSELAMNNHSSFDLSPFAIDRKVLTVLHNK